MRYISFIIICLLSFIAVSQTTSPGQRKGKPWYIPNPVDTSFMEVIYSYKVYDDYLKLQKEFFDILEIGDDYSYYSCYGYYRTDSIGRTDYPDGIVQDDYRQLRRKTHPRTDLNILKDFREGAIKCEGFILMDFYLYEESIPEMKWTLLPTSEEICGYKCYQATTNFRGRKWTVWYCDDIPQNNGPWKFNGLPGLILKAQDITGDHIFEAIAIRKSNKPFGLKKRRRIPIDRVKFNETLAEFKLNPNIFMTGTPLAPKDKDGNEMKGNRMFFNPLELE